MGLVKFTTGSFEGSVGTDAAGNIEIQTHNNEHEIIFDGAKAFSGSLEFDIDKSTGKKIKQKARSLALGKEFIRSGSGATSNQIEMEQTTAAAFITVSGSNPGFNIRDVDDSINRLIRPYYDTYVVPDVSWRTGVDKGPGTAWSGSFVIGTSANSFTDGTSMLVVSRSGDVVVPNGNLIANNYVVSSSVTHVTTLAQSGSTAFGDTGDDIHAFTGSVNISGSLLARSGSFNKQQAVNTKTQSVVEIQSDGSTNAYIYLRGTNSTKRNAGIYLDRDDVNGSSKVHFLSDEVTNWTMGTLAAGGLDMVFSSSAASNFGIGNSTPTKKLTVEGDISASGNFIAQGNISQSNSTSTGSFGFGVIRNKLGVGTHQPDYDLDVAGTVGVANYIYHNGDEDTHILMEADMINLVAGGKSGIKIDQDEGWIRLNNTNADLDTQVNDKNGDISLHTDAAKHSVGIYTTTPVTGSTARLSVEGGISASGGYFGATIHTTGSLANGESSGGDIIRQVNINGDLKGQVVYHTGGDWRPADKDTEAKVANLLGVALGNDGTFDVLVRGFVRLASGGIADSGGDEGDPVYLADDGTVKFAPSTTSGDFNKIVGYCINEADDIIWFDPDKTWVEVS